MGGYKSYPTKGITISHSISKHADLIIFSVTLACNCLDELISKRLLVLEQYEWIERAFVTRLWMGVKNNTSLEGNTLVTLKKLVDCECLFR